MAGNKKPRVNGVSHLKEVRGCVVCFRSSRGDQDSNLFNVSRLQKLSPGLDLFSFLKDRIIGVLKGLVSGFHRFGSGTVKNRAQFS